jgi:hypothetical protein
MDTGMTRSSKLLFDPLARLSAEEVCWVMDEMLALEVSPLGEAIAEVEMAWYRGATLCQTVFTSLYYLNPHQMQPSSVQSSHAPPPELVTLVLRSFALAHSKSIDLAYAEFSKYHVNDGEDCCLDDYGLPIRLTDSVDEIVNFVDQALRWLDIYIGKSSKIQHR